MNVIVTNVLSAACQRGYNSRPHPAPVAAASFAAPVAAAPSKAAAASFRVALPLILLLMLCPAERLLKESKGERERDGAREVSANAFNICLQLNQIVFLLHFFPSCCSVFLQQFALFLFLLPPLLVCSA